MSKSAGADGATYVPVPPPGAARGVRQWELWSQPRGFILAVGALGALALSVGHRLAPARADADRQLGARGAILLLSAAFELVTVG